MGPAPLARYFPRQDLVVYAEFDGLDAHRDAWTRTAAYRLLNETTTGAMYEQSISRILGLILAKQSGLPVNGRDLEMLGVHLLRSGFAVGINRAGGAGPPRCFAVVIRAAAKGEPRATLDRILRAGAPPRAPVKQVDRPDGRKLQVLSGPPADHLAWWAEGDDLVVSLVSAGGPDAIIAALESREPNAVEHPNRVALIRGDDAQGFVPVGLSFFDMAALPPSLPRAAVALGLDGVKRFDYRWGFHDRALESMVGVVASSPRRGIPALFDQPGFDVRRPAAPARRSGRFHRGLPGSCPVLGRLEHGDEGPEHSARPRRARRAGSTGAGPFVRRPACGCERISSSTWVPDSRSTTCPPRSTLRRTFWRALPRASFAFPRWRS